MQGRPRPGDVLDLRRQAALHGATPRVSAVQGHARRRFSAPSPQMLLLPVQRFLLRVNTSGHRLGVLGGLLEHFHFPT